MSPQKTVGVFALQGDVREHVHVLEALGARTRPVRRPADLEGLDGIVLPGGESSVMDRLARIMGLKDPLIAALRDGLPAYGTCAGLIMLAREIRNPAPDQGGLGVLDLAVGADDGITQGAESGGIGAYVDKSQFKGYKFVGAGDEGVALVFRLL